MIRILHFSDIHYLPHLGTLALRDFFALRRIAGWLNYALFRRWRFAASDAIVDALAAWSAKEAFDANLFTGDATSLGTPGEIELARKKLDVFAHLPGGLLVIPGNHDRYVLDTSAGNRFDATFSDLYRSDLPETQTDGHWPQVRLFGSSAAILLLHGALPHRNILFSSGSIPEVQLAGLDAALSHASLRNRTVLIAAHHGPFSSDGRHDSIFHGLDDSDAVFARLRRHPGAIFVHGHIHQRFYHPATNSHIPVFCAGSATFAGRESAWVFEIDHPTGNRAIPADFTSGGWVARYENSVPLPCNTKL
ncbi:MAG: metallophosphoesterase [Candidatus Riflebacteria bacterium]|nr:metallophosphoesterase [Candidatus Riflebacteria bacterium]